MKQWVRYVFAKALNYILPKESNSVFAEPHKNGKNERQDITNYAGDSVLSFINFLIMSERIGSYKIYLVIYDLDRIEATKDFITKNKLGTITIIAHYSCFTGIKSKIQKVRYEIKKMRTKVWLCATVHANKKYAVRSQKLVCLEYFASFKSDYGDVAFNYLPKRWSLVCSTSMFDSAIKSAAFAIPFCCFQPLGLARNDYLFRKSPKENCIKEWIYMKTGKEFTKIVIYAPTFRDYEKYSTEKRNLWGYHDNSNINRILEENNAIVIAKMHSWQNIDVIMGECANVIYFEPTFEYTIYDLMTISDVLITDYSSIGLDFLLINKPVIYNLYDKDKYFKTRGMCIEPIDEICGGEIVEDERSLAESIQRCLNNGYKFCGAERVREMYFKYKDGNSCERIYEFLKKNEVL